MLGFFKGLFLPNQKIWAFQSASNTSLCNFRSKMIQGRLLLKDLRNTACATHLPSAAEAPIWAFVQFCLDENEHLEMEKVTIKPKQSE